jgi:hypothetical protein
MKPTSPLPSFQKFPLSCFVLLLWLLFFSTAVQNPSTFKDFQGLYEPCKISAKPNIPVIHHASRVDNCPVRLGKVLEKKKQKHTHKHTQKHKKKHTNLNVLIIKVQPILTTWVASCRARRERSARSSAPDESVSAQSAQGTPEEHQQFPTATRHWRPRFHSATGKPGVSG